MHWLRLTWWISLAALIVQAAWYWPRLPERLASHFDASGTPDGYASRSEFMLVWIFAIVLVNVTPLILGPLIRKLPSRFVNTPNRDYWLANPERRERMIAIVNAMISGALLGANIILLLAFQYTIDQNIGDRSLPISMIWIGVAVEILLSVGSVAWGLIKLGNPPDDRLPTALS